MALKLAFHPQIPLRRVLHNSVFSITVLLLSSVTNQLKSDSNNIPIEVLLTSGAREFPNGISILKTGSNIIKGGKCILSLKIIETSLSLGVDQLELIVKCRIADQQLIASQQLICYKHRLKITNSGNIPSTFFKDDIGKDKFIDACLAVVDGDDQLVQSRRLRLKATLMYAAPNEVEVGRQDMLTITSDSRLIIDDSGTAFLRFRINDVSKNHLQQSFQVLIAPDTDDSPIDIDIEPISTVPIVVKSKRKRTSETAGKA